MAQRLAEHAGGGTEIDRGAAVRFERFRQRNRDQQGDQSDDRGQHDEHQLP